MATDEVFENPTVKQVIFQIRFPSLFSMENKIGDFQFEVMEMFPQSSLRISRQILLADVGPEGRMVGVPDELERLTSKKIWQFESGKEFTLNITGDSLDISSGQHKTYCNPKFDNKFRDVIEFVLSRFLKKIPIVIINRIGLRYIDECPIPEMKNDKFKEWYNTKFPLNYFDISDASEMSFVTVIKKGIYRLRYNEILLNAEHEPKLMLDFDAFGEKIKPNDYMTVTDSLYKIVSDEYWRTIKEPVIEFMRIKKEIENA